MPTPTEIARIAAAINLLRPDWPTISIQSYLADQHRHRPYQDLAIAATWIATDPDTKTPARLDKPGPWWHISAGTEAARHPSARPISELWRNDGTRTPATPAEQREAIARAKAQLALAREAQARPEGETA